MSRPVRLRRETRLSVGIRLTEPNGERAEYWIDADSQEVGVVNYRPDGTPETAGRMGLETFIAEVKRIRAVRFPGPVPSAP